jgi:hypothetical protein
MRAARMAPAAVAYRTVVGHPFRLSKRNAYATSITLGMSDSPLHNSINDGLQRSHIVADPALPAVPNLHGLLIGSRPSTCVQGRSLSTRPRRTSGRYRQRPVACGQVPARGIPLDFAARTAADTGSGKGP